MRRALIILLILIAVTAVGIFGQSMLGSSSSWAESDVIAYALEPVLGQMHSLVLGVFTQLGADVSGFLTYGVFVRKLAHFLEYALLGAECAAVMAVATRRVLSPYLWTCLFVVLMAAVIDEFVQSLTGRTSLVADVLLDFSGGVAGIAFALVVAAIVFAVSGRRAKGL